MIYIKNNTIYLHLGYTNNQLLLVEFSDYQSTPPKLVTCDSNIFFNNAIIADLSKHHFNAYIKRVLDKITHLKVNLYYNVGNTHTYILIHYYKDLYFEMVYNGKWTYYPKPVYRSASFLTRITDNIVYKEFSVSEQDNCMELLFSDNCQLAYSLLKIEPILYDATNFNGMYVSPLNIRF